MSRERNPHANSVPPNGLIHPRLKPWCSVGRRPTRIENTAAAKFAATQVHEAKVTKTDFDTLLLETLASNVHEDWLARNGHVNEPARDPGEEALRAIQRLPYTDKNFTEQEKNKDRIHIVLATETYAAARLFPDDIETRILPT